MRTRRFTRSLLAVLVLVALFGNASALVAGTTGSLSGTVQESGTNTPIAGAKVTATSASQSVSATTDAGGHFTFASLAPDSYTVSVEKQGFGATSRAGINVFADQSQTLTLGAERTLRTIARVTTRADTNLVKPGTTADVYSVNALQQDKFSGVGGGGGLNSAYSAIATVPGAYVPLNQQGYFQTIHIRGGDYDQVGYELDGVPVNRSFDNYPSGAASSLGQQELQVYTGAAPANAEAQGLSGFINQVIRTGTYPGFVNAALGLGGPAYYHKATFEFGGASSNRNFSYYVGVGGYNQDFRYVDQGNAQGLRPWGQIANTLGSTLTKPELTAYCADPVRASSYFSCYANGGAAPAGFVNAPLEFGNVSTINDRDTVVNVHVGIPHHNGDGSKDDVQFLYVNNFLRTQYFSSSNDLGAVALQGQPVLTTDSYLYGGTVGATLPANAASLIKPYFYPDISQHAFGAPLPGDNRDSYQNDQSIFKVQYQKNFSSNAYFRLYGYSYYSDWLQNGADYAGIVNAGSTAITSPSRQYILASHTRGLSGTFADQINAQHLIQFQGAYTTATSVRDNNRTMNDGAGGRSLFATLVDPAAPTNGLCYAIPTAGSVATPAVCDTGAPAAQRSSYLSLPQVAGATGQPAIPSINGLTCGTSTCQWYVVENGQNATYNTVKPNFYSGSLTDNIKPSDKLAINVGLRYNLYQFQGSDTSATPARTLFFNAFNQDNCINSQSGQPVYKTSAALGLKVTDPCPTGFTTPTLANVSSQINTYPEFEPRLGFTYTVTPDTVVRASYGRYSQAPNAAFEQYNSLQQNLPAGGGLLRNFYAFGFTTPGHNVRPEVSNNYDISLEHHFKGTDLTFKLTPFYRYTQNQIQLFYLDQPTMFVSGLNANRLTSRGVEFQASKGDFGRDGFAAQLSFAYTDAYAQYNTLSNGTTVFTGINNDIANYNQYTSFCATKFSDTRCGGLRAAPVNASPCFTTAGVPSACTGATIANPYYNAPVQSLVDTNGKYPPFSLVTGPIGASAESYNVPYVSTLILQYKKGPLALTPSIQFAGGQRYGVPESSAGIDPAAGCNAFAGSTASDPRYPYGAAGGAPYDAASCAGLLAAIPNPYTRGFDRVGSFVEPNQLVANLQIAYQASKRVSFVATFANIINNCFGGSNVPWATGGSNACTYGLVSNGNAYPYYGNVYNPNSVIDPAVQYPYERAFGAFNTDAGAAQLKNPFGVFVDARIRI